MAGGPAAWAGDFPSSARSVITGHRTFTNRPNSTRMTPEIAQLGYRQIDQDAVDAVVSGWNHGASHPSS